MLPEDSLLQAQDRERIVKIYSSLTGDFDTAEDLAQEALVEAWRNRYKLQDDSGKWKWLSSIARNVYLRWAREKGKESKLQRALENWNYRTSLKDDLDISIELEREDLARLLDEAMMNLPPQTRSILLQHFIEELPRAEIAQRLGISEGAVAVRLHRGKLLLKKILLSQHQQEAFAYNVNPALGNWQTTDIWCPFCGINKLRAKLDPPSDTFLMKCPQCTPSSDDYLINGSQIGLAKSSRSLKSTFDKLIISACKYYGEGLRKRQTQCLICGKSVPLWVEYNNDLPIPAAKYSIITICQNCKDRNSSLLAGHALSLPQGRRFWKKNSRIHMLPEQTIEREGRQAVVTAFENMHKSSKYEVVYAIDNYEILLINSK